MRRWQHWTAQTGVLLGLAMGVTSGVHSACDPARSEAQPDTRFVVQDDVVLDTTTKLTWKRCSEGQVWSATEGCQGAARKFNCEQAKVTDTRGWRVPTVEELENLVAKGCRKPSINEAVFPNTPSATYWTSSKDESSCWRVDFEYGGTYLSNWWDTHHLRLVRGGK